MPLPKALQELEIRERDKLVTENKRLRAALNLAKDALERNTGNYSFVLQAITDALR